MTAGGLSCGPRCAKYILFLFNLIFWMCGAAILGVGIWVMVDPNALSFLKIATIDSSDHLVRVSAITLIAVGSVVFFTGFLGCCGAVRESPGMLCLYAGILVLILIVQVAAGIVAAVYRNKISEILTTSMNRTVQTRYGMNNQTVLTEAWDLMQTEFKCCGSVNGPSDWATSNWKLYNGNSTVTVPLTCCVLKNPGDYKNPIPVNVAECYRAATNSSPTSPDTYIHTKGCEESLFNWVQSHAGILIGIAFGIAFIEIFGVVFACCLRSEVKNIGVYA